MAPRRAAAAGPRSIPDAADTRWLQTLSEPELGLLIGLKELAVTRASNAGHPDLADKVFHLGALRALALVLLEESKERLRQASSVVNITMLERLALLNDPDPEQQQQQQQVEDVMPMPNGIIPKKRKQIMQDGCHGVQRGENQQERRTDWAAKAKGKEKQTASLTEAGATLLELECKEAMYNAA